MLRDEEDAWSKYAGCFTHDIKLHTATSTSKLLDHDILVIDGLGFCQSNRPHASSEETSRQEDGFPIFSSRYINSARVMHLLIELLKLREPRIHRNAVHHPRKSDSSNLSYSTLDGWGVGMNLALGCIGTHK